MYALWMNAPLKVSHEPQTAESYSGADFHSSPAVVLLCCHGLDIRPLTGKNQSKPVKGCSERSPLFWDETSDRPQDDMHRAGSLNCLMRTEIISYTVIFTFTSVQVSTDGKFGLSFGHSVTPKLFWWLMVVQCFTEILDGRFPQMCHPEPNLYNNIKKIYSQKTCFSLEALFCSGFVVLSHLRLGCMHVNGPHEEQKQLTVLA